MKVAARSWQPCAVVRIKSTHGRAQQPGRHVDRTRRDDRTTIDNIDTLIPKYADTKNSTSSIACPITRASRTRCPRIRVHHVLGHEDVERCGVKPRALVAPAYSSSLRCRNLRTGLFAYQLPVLSIMSSRATGRVGLQIGGASSQASLRHETPCITYSSFTNTRASRTRPRKHG